GDHVGDFGVIDAHRNLADLPGLLLAFKPALLFHVNDLTAAKHIGELVLEPAPRLTGQHLENVAAQHVLAIYSEAADFAIAIPRHDSHVAINDVKRDGKGIDDLFGETLLLFSFTRALRHFHSEIDRSVLRPPIQFGVSDCETQLLRDSAKKFLIIRANRT